MTNEELQQMADDLDDCVNRIHEGVQQVDIGEELHDPYAFMTARFRFNDSILILEKYVKKIRLLLQAEVPVPETNTADCPVAILEDARP